MPREDVIPLSARNEWQAALAGLPHTFGHTWENCHVQALYTEVPTYLWHIEHNGVRAVNVFFEREYHGYKDIAKPFGYSGFVSSGPFPELPTLWRSFAIRSEYICGYLGLNPIFSAHTDFPNEDILTYDSVHLIDLTSSETELWNNLSTDRRREMRNHAGPASRIVHDKKILTPFFVDNFMGYMTRKNATSTYKLNRAALEFLCELDNVILSGVGPAETITAATLCVHTPNCGEGMFYISTDNSPNYSSILTWNDAILLRERGIPLINIGGGSPGIHRFKNGFGGYQKPLRCIQQIYDSDRYQKLCELSGKDPNCGYFPAYRG